MADPIQAVSLFSGVGGFDLGLSKSGVEIIWANDINPIAATAYKSLFPNVEFVLDDIERIKSFPKAEVLIGCYPCTGFSQAAKRRWKNRTKRDLVKNPKNFLFKEFLRAIRYVKPNIIFIENVKGMLSASNGYFLDEQLQGLTELGFNKVDLKLLNAADYGLAQSRQRLFIVGIHNSLRDLEYAFPEATHSKREDKRPFNTLRDVICDMPLNPEGEYYTKEFHGHYLTRNRKRYWDEPSYTIVASQEHVPLHPGGEQMTKLSADQWQLEGDFNRRLSYRECLAIQGLPANMKLEGALTNKYKVVGNAVPPTLANAVSKQLIQDYRSLYK